MNRLACFLAGLLRDLTLGRAALIKENAFLRAQLQAYKATVKRPRLDAHDRILLVLLSKLIPQWREFLTIVTPDTLVGWARDGYRSFWNRFSSAHRRPPAGRKLSPETRELIRPARETRWGSKRIVGELHSKLGVHVHKKTVQKILRRERPPRAPGQTWRTFLANHIDATWATDFFTVPTWFHGNIYVHFFMKVATREILHWNVTYHPTPAWTTQQLKNALSWCGTPPRFLVHDRDGNFGGLFDELLRGEGIEVVGVSSPIENSHAERFIGSVRREALRHFVVIGEKHLRWILGEYITHHNAQRPHQGLGQRIPAEVEKPIRRLTVGRIVRRDVLNGLIREYSCAA
jgi:putative transposase